jgi:hypothetical protein
MPEILKNYDPVLNGTVDQNDTIDDSYREGKALGGESKSEVILVLT